MTTNSSNQRESRLARLTPLTIALIYALMGGLWILFSDRLVAELVTDPAALTEIQTYKGWFYILATAGLLYLLIKRSLTTLSYSEVQLRATSMELETALQRLTFHVENSPLAVIEWDHNFRVRHWSRRAEQLFGWTAEEVRGKNPLEIGFVYPDDVPVVEQVVSRLLTGSQPRNVNRNRNYTKEGAVIHCVWYESVLFDDAGQLVSILSLVHDVTAQVEAEEALGLSEERFAKAFRASPDVLVISQQSSGRILEVNESWQHVFGYNREEVIGRTSLEFNLYVNLEDRHHIFKQLAEPGFVRDVEVEMRCKSGEIRQINFSAERINIRDEVCWLGILRDITKRKQAEESLRESEERFRATFEQAAVGLSHVDLDGRWLRVNQKLCEIIGYTHEELMQVTFADITHPEDLQADLDQAKRLVGGEIQTYSMEKRYFRKDSSQIWVNLTVSLLRDASGQPKYYIAVVQDITERKQLEEQFRQSQKMEAIGLLAGGVAHDFNNLLTVITGYTELTFNHLNKDDPLRKNLQEIRKASERATRLTRQLLAFSRRQVLQPTLLDLNEIVNQTGEMLRRLLGEDIELITLLPAGLGRVKADPAQIEQVIINLAVNARDAMPQGGKLTIELANIELDEEYARQHVGVTPGSYIRLALSDTGLGMDKATLSRIFEPFFTTKEPDKGTGLGLAMVYGIVSQSGGAIRVYSEPGWGTTFKIYLPQVNEAAEPILPPALPPPTSPVSETILLVEDEPSVRALVGDTLKEEGYTVLEASNSAEALRLDEQYAGPIHLLLTDVVMPGLSGGQLAKRLGEVRPRLKVLYMSGYTDNAIVHHGVLDPGVFFLHKPFTPQVLTRKVREVLDRPQ